MNTRWVLAWQVVEDKRDVKARLVDKGCQGLDLKAGPTVTWGCVSLRSPHLRAISLSVPRRRELWSVDIKNALLRADSCEREVYLRAPVEWEP